MQQIPKRNKPMQENGSSHEMIQRAKKKAMNLLERQDRTQEQLTKKLQNCGFSQEAVNEALDYVKSFHYVDDRRFAENYIRYRQNEKSRQRLKMDLLQKGVPETFIEEALEEVYEADEKQMICHLLEKKHYDPAQADLKERNRIMGFLMRRGFSLEKIRTAMREYEVSKDEII